MTTQESCAKPQEIIKGIQCADENRTATKLFCWYMSGVNGSRSATQRVGVTEDGAGKPHSVNDSIAYIARSSQFGAEGPWRSGGSGR